MTSTESGRIWIGCLAAYNAGTLHGKWLPASDIREGIAEVLRTSPIANAEEWFVADYDDFPNLGEYPSIESVERMAEALDSASDREAFTAFVASEGAQYATLEDFEERFRGRWSSLADFAEDFIEDCYGDCLKGLPEFIHYRIDWKGIAYDFECGGDFSTIDAGGGEVFVFSSH